MQKLLFGENLLKKVLPQAPFPKTLHSFDGGFGESAMLMGTYPELIRLDRCEAESGLKTHISDPLTSRNILWGRSWSKNFPNAYAGHAPIGLTQQIADAAVEISVERTVEVLRILKDDSIMEPILNA